MSSSFTSVVLTIKTNVKARLQKAYQQPSSFKYRTNKSGPKRRGHLRKTATSESPDCLYRRNLYAFFELRGAWRFGPKRELQLEKVARPPAAVSNGDQMSQGCRSCAARVSIHGLLAAPHSGRDDRGFALKSDVNCKTYHIDRGWGFFLSI